MIGKRRKTKEILIGDVRIGAGYPISVQSMTKTDTKDVAGTVRQIKALERAGCDIVRVAVGDMLAAEAIGEIKKKTGNLPLVADIHFHYQLALKVIANGIDGIRLNPGNINKREEIKKIVKQAKRFRVPIRVGVNSGSLLPLSRLSSSKPPKTADMMVENAQNYIKLLEDLDFCDIIISLKASNVVDTIEAYRRMAKLCDYPFHLGITATGLKHTGNIRSAIAIGTLLLEGIGDTIRVSLTAKAQEEVKAAQEILTSLGLRCFGPRIISCPTCGRCQVNLIKIVKELERKLAADSELQTKRAAMKIAVMGCVVNGPGEAKDADLGIACGKGSGILFHKGEKVKKVKERDMVKVLLEEIISQ